MGFMIMYNYCLLSLYVCVGKGPGRNDYARKKKRSEKWVMEEKKIINLTIRFGEFMQSPYLPYGITSFLPCVIHAVPLFILCYYLICFVHSKSVTLSSISITCCTSFTIMFEIFRVLLLCFAVL